MVNWPYYELLLLKYKAKHSVAIYPELYKLSMNVGIPPDNVAKLSPKRPLPSPPDIPETLFTRMNV